MAGVADVEEWLTANADIQQCDELNADSAGVIWIQGPCTGGDALNGQIGTPAGLLTLTSRILMDSRP
ncbi:hypothetical protein D3C83_53030 [compost metagenome]